jgi:hypothetical protein
LQGILCQTFSFLLISLSSNPRVGLIFHTRLSITHSSPELFLCLGRGTSLICPKHSFPSISLHGVMLRCGLQTERRGVFKSIQYLRAFEKTRRAAPSRLLQASVVLQIRRSCVSSARSRDKQHE